MAVILDACVYVRAVDTAWTWPPEMFSVHVPCFRLTVINNFYIIKTIWAVCFVDTFAVYVK